MTSWRWTTSCLHGDDIPQPGVALQQLELSLFCQLTIIPPCERCSTIISAGERARTKTAALLRPRSDRNNFLKKEALMREGRSRSNDLSRIVFCIVFASCGRR